MMMSTYFTVSQPLARLLRELWAKVGDGVKG